MSNLRVILQDRDTSGNSISIDERVCFSSILSGVISSFHNAARFLDDEPVMITNNPNADAPVFFSKSNSHFPFDTIILNCAGFSYWCQVIYQLSHELAHCAISRINDGNQGNKVSWIEETICEAASLYSLKWFSDNWASVSISERNPTFSENIKTYLEDLLSKEGTKRLSNCRSVCELEEINRTSQEKRDDRRNEMNRIFSLLGDEDLFALFSYRNFVKPGTIALDTTAYSKAYQSVNAVHYLCALQDQILLHS